MIKGIAHQRPQCTECDLDQTAQKHGTDRNKPVAHQRKLEIRNDIDSNYTEYLAEYDVAGLKISDFQSAECTGEKQYQNKIDEDNEYVSSEVIL